MKVASVRGETASITKKPMNTILVALCVDLFASNFTSVCICLLLQAPMVDSHKRGGNHLAGVTLF